MSRNAEDGFNTYEELYNRGINLVFLKEPHINTDTYKKSLTGLVSMTNTNVDFILEGINKYLLALAKEQIRLAFEQAEKEVEDLHQRTKEGIETAKLAGKQIGKSKGDTWETKKSKEVSGEKYPVVVFVNGTGVAASRYKPVFEHLASWGFIAIGNEDPSTWEGKKADATLSWLLAANEDETSIFYHRVDTNIIGITGHSQGGVGVFHAINETEHKELYKCAVSLSPTQEDMAEALKMPYDSSKTAIPVMILAGAPNDVISLEGLNDMVKKISAGVVAARRSNTDHGQMLYSGDGYVTAWFMWQLQGDETAAAAFLGENAEILHNANWQDVMINFPNN